jgi:SWIM zinc finger
MAQAALVSPVGRQRQASPERWQKAAQRALAEGIEVRQVNASGMWVANSGSQAAVAYVLEIGLGIVHSCSCPAGTFGDPCCKHAARYYLNAGLLELDDPEPEPPAPAAISCFRCCGAQAGCPVCQGAGVAPLTTQAAALVGVALAA